MKIYRASIRQSDQEHSEYFYSLSKTEAKKKQSKREGNKEEVVELELSMNKWDVINFLNTHCSCLDND